MMKKIALCFCLATLVFGADLRPKDFDAYLKGFNVEEVKNMKISCLIIEPNYNIFLSFEIFFINSR